MTKNPLRTIRDFDQSIWQDDIKRQMILSGELQRLIEEDGIRGVTSNPAIFKKAISGGREYEHDIQEMVRQGRIAEQIYHALTVKDLQMAADQFRPLYDASDGKHGFVSLEVNPHLAREVDGTLAEARRLWKVLNRPNAMIKVPATVEGLICIHQLISEGLNINATLLFGLDRYRHVAEAYISGLEARAEAGLPLERIASVASFFLSRIDVWINPILKKIIGARGPGADRAEEIYGRVAIASAKCAYWIHKEIFESDRFHRLVQNGARDQRLLWASTSTKEEEFSDVKYVEALIGPNTINTLPQKTIKAYRDHGRPAQRLTADMDQAREVIESLAGLEINIDQVTQGLENQGIDKFIKPYDSLMETLREYTRNVPKAP
jgi:transaldolase